MNSIDILGENRVKIKLPDGYSGAVDQWNGNNGTDFEIHIFDEKDNEVAIIKSNGGYHDTHGTGKNKKVLKCPSELPKDLKKGIRKQVSQRRKSAGMRAAGVGALLYLLNTIKSAADGTNDAQINDLINEVEMFAKHKAGGDEANADGDAAAIAQGLQGLFGSDTAAMNAWNALQAFDPNAGCKKLDSENNSKDKQKNDK